MAVILLLVLIYLLVVCPLFALVQIGLAKDFKNKPVWIIALLIVGPLAAVPYFIIYGRNPITKYIHSGLIVLIIVMSAALYSVRDKFMAVYDEQIQIIERMKNCPEGEICL